jgi:ATP-dependent Clp protease ATP-binding subunit ClpA
MPKINVYLPDELAEAVRDADLPVSTICQRALEYAVRRVTAIRETVLGELDIDDPDGRLAQFTARARVVLRLAIERARADGASRVGTDQVLAGMLAEGSNLALNVLRAMEIEPGQVERELGQVSATAEAGDGEAPRQLSAPAANAMELAVAEAAGLGHNYVGCEHLLLGLVSEPDGTAGQVLRSLGAEPRLTRRAVTAALAGYVHLRAQTSGPGGGQPPADMAKLLTAAIRREMLPLTERIARLERHVGIAADPS